MNYQWPVQKDVILAGAGHSHVAVVRSFGMRPLPGVRLTLVSPGGITPYSGMLPGFVAGHYSVNELHIDIRRLCKLAGVRYIDGEVMSVEAGARLLHLADRPPLSFDILSINCGSAPNVGSIPGADQHAIAVKPISRFVSSWTTLYQQLQRSRPAAHTVAVIGAGAGGVELLLALLHRMRHSFPTMQITPLLFTAGALLKDHNPGVRSRLQRSLDRAGVIRLDDRVERVGSDGLFCGGQTYPADSIFCVTEAAAPQWLQGGDLTLSEQGFIAVNQSLQSLSHDWVFAAGDVADCPGVAAKSGVFAVRQGPVLSDNLRRYCRGRKLREYRPQRHYLSLISLGDKRALASRAGWSLQGRWLWGLKDWIDRRFMARFNEMPAMTDAPPRSQAHQFAEVSGALEHDPMRCAGCGAKVGANVLNDVLRGLQPVVHEGVLSGIDGGDDAALIMLPGSVVAWTVDSFPALLDDPCLFGRIAAEHSLSDLFAMGAVPHSALAIVSVPHADSARVKADLRQVMAGAVEVLDRHGCALVGGHTGEGAQLSVGFTVTGMVHGDPLTKTGLAPDDALILTKPLGTGVLFAAEMKGLAVSEGVERALHYMLQSNRPGADIIRQHQAHACTDITGFGLLGHLGEMMRDSELSVRLDVAALPLLPGAELAASAGIRSSLFEQNLAAVEGLIPQPLPRRQPRIELLFDPQTSGGLLAAIPATQAGACLAALHSAGIDAACIGQVQHDGGDQKTRVSFTGA